jgi:hypothetical protein
VLVVNNLFHGADYDRSTSNCVNLVTLFLLLLILRLESLLVLDELLFHGQIILDTLLAEQSQSALGRWSDYRCGVKFTRVRYLP